MIVIRSKAEREKYPYYKTVAELFDMKLKPYRSSSPKAKLCWRTKTRYRVAYLYDVRKAIPLTQNDIDWKKEELRKKREDRKLRNEWLKRIEEIKAEVLPCQKVIIDIDTTGHVIDRDRILRFSAMNESGDILMNEFIDPVTFRYSNDDLYDVMRNTVKGCPTMEQVRERIQMIIFSATEIIVYNTDYIFPFLKRVPIEIPEVPIVDVLDEFAPIYNEKDFDNLFFVWPGLRLCAEFYGYKLNKYDGLEHINAFKYCYESIKRNPRNITRERAEAMKEWRLYAELLRRGIKPKQKVIFDIETTGLDPEEDEILQISAINEHGEVLINEYVKPYNHASWPEAERVNHITGDMVREAGYFSSIRESVQRIMFTATELIAYNGAFDLAFLRKSWIVIPDVPYTDVMKEFAPIYGEWSEEKQDYKWKKLAECASYYGYEYEAHNSLEDVKATLFCYEQMRKK